MFDYTKIFHGTLIDPIDKIDRRIRKNFIHRHFITYTRFADLLISILMLI